MASRSVVAAIEARLGVSWASVDGTVLPVIHNNNDGAVPGDGSQPFMSVSYPVANARLAGMAGVGNRTYREDGGFTIEVCITTGQDIGQALGWCDELIALFLAQSFGGVTTYVPSPPSESVNETGAFYVLRIAVPYYFDYVA